MAAVHAYQILDQRRGEALLPGFEALAAGAGPRTDWEGYETLRARLMGGALDAQAFYGFYSVMHGVPPALAALRACAACAAASTDVLLLDAGAGEDAYFWNVFEAGEFHHPGLLAVAQRCFARIGRPQTLQTLVSDSRHTAGPGAFVARPRFWRSWLDITEALYAIAENPADELGAALRAGAPAPNARAMKVLIVERIATFLLMTDATLKVEHCTAGGRAPGRRLALACDALKMAYALTGRSQYRLVFGWLRGWAVSRGRAG